MRGFLDMLSRTDGRTDGQTSMNPQASAAEANRAKFKFKCNPLKFTCDAAIKLNHQVVELDLAVVKNGNIARGCVVFSIKQLIRACCSVVDV